MNNKNYIKFMKVAISEAKKGKGLTSPNPAVGCVIVNNNIIIGKGYHKKSGEPHAEVNAINNVIKKMGKIPGNSEIYVTLEPCSHYGKTPPCADLIIKHKFKKAIIAIQDPNKLVAGKGIQKIKAAGIDVVENILKEKAYELNEDFFYSIKYKTPFIVLKTAITLDGRLATLNNNSKWISNLKARIFAHKLRKDNFGIMVGSNTLKIDNPSLNIRLIKSKKNNSKIIIPSSSLNINLNANIFKINNPKDIFIGYDKKKADTKIIKALKNLNINLISVKSKNQYLNLKDFMFKLYDKGINSILIEGGSQLISELLKLNLINKLHLIIAPKIMGSGISWVNNIKCNNVKNAFNLKNINFKKLDDNIIISGYLL